METGLILNFERRIVFIKYKEQTFFIFAENTKCVYIDAFLKVLKNTKCVYLDAFLNKQKIRRTLCNDGGRNITKR